jgi:hypothetical protein
VKERRVPIVVLLVAALVALLVVGRDDGDAPVRRLPRAASEVLPTADAAGALGSTWYCAAGTSVAGGPANLTVVVANPTASARAGSVTWMPTPGRPVTTSFVVAPHDARSLDAHDALDADVVSAVVETTGGGVVVEHLVAGPRGRSAAACASAPSTHWYLAGGTTERDAAQVLAVFNPFPDDAVIDVTLQTENGRRRPTDLRGLPIPAGSTAHIDVGASAGRHATTATAVVARTGRVVVDRVERFDGSAGRSGLALTLAAPAAAEEWHFPEGVWTATSSERWHVFNPGAEEAVVSLEVVPTEGDAPEPRDVTVPPGGQVVLESDEEEAGIVADVAHASTLRSLNGVPFVAERELDVRSTTRRGWSSVPGSPVTARHWAFAVGEASSSVDEWIVVQNPGPRKLRFSVAALASFRRLPIEGLQDIEVPPAGRVAVRLGDHLQRGPLPILVEATGPVVAERDLYLLDQIGITTSIGIPW